jgi:hypothetical protein
MLAGFMSGLVFACFGAAFGASENQGFHDAIADKSGPFVAMSFLVYQCAFVVLQQAQWTAISSFFLAGAPRNSDLAARFVPALLMAVILHAATYVLYSCEWFSGLATILMFSIQYTLACKLPDDWPLSAEGLRLQDPEFVRAVNEVTRRWRSK